MTVMVKVLFKNLGQASLMRELHERETLTAGGCDAILRGLMRRPII